MGFKAVRTIEIAPTDGPYAGLEVTFKSMSLGAALDIEDLRSKGSRAVTDLAKLVSGYVVAWNLVDDAETPIPTTSEGLLSVDNGVFSFLVTEWLQQVAQVPAPLGLAPSAGATSLELSMPMEIPSPSPQNGPMPD